MQYRPYRKKSNFCRPSKCSNNSNGNCNNNSNNNSNSNSIDNNNNKDFSIRLFQATCN